jgi:DNA-binding NtrC family response regulator
MADILVVDDEIGIRELLSEILGDEGHTVHLAENASQARECRERQEMDLVLLDIWMPDTDGVTLLKEWAANGRLNMPVIMMSGHATIDTAVEATRIGALDFLEKPIALQKLLKAVQTGLQRARASKISGQGSAPADNGSFRGFTGSPGMGGGQAASAQSLASLPLTPGVSPPGTQITHTLHVTPMGLRPQQEPQGFVVQGGVGYVPQANGHGAVSMNPGVMSQGAPSVNPHQGLMQDGMGSPSIAATLLRDIPLEMPLREARDAFERVYFEHHLSREHGSMTRVAERTGLERTHLYRKLKQLGIDLSKGAYRKQQS